MSNNFGAFRLELAACHNSGAYKIEAVSRYLDYLFTPGLESRGNYSMALICFDVKFHFLP